MSLLMDALKKAELAKRLGQADGGGTQADGAASQGGLALEPLGDANSPQPHAAATPPADGGADILPHLPSHLEELDAQFLAEAKQAASARLKASHASAAGREPASDQPTPKEAPGRDCGSGPGTNPDHRTGRTATVGAEPVQRQAGGPAAGAEIVCRRHRRTHRTGRLRHRRVFLVAVAAEGGSDRQPRTARPRPDSGPRIRKRRYRPVEPAGRPGSRRLGRCSGTARRHAGGQGIRQDKRGQR
jgi:hypothetical protein